MQSFKKKLSILLVFGMILSFSATVSAASAVNYTQRTTAPTSGTPGYSSAYGNPFETNWQGGNCTWYAWGRAYEILGKPLPSLPMHRSDNTYGFNSFRSDARIWWYDNKELYDSGRGGFAYGKEPRVGSIAVWDYLASSAGHVAVVEEVNGDYVKTSNSSWSWLAFYMSDLSKSELAGNSNFLGYIYLLDETDPHPYRSAIDLPSEGENVTKDSLYVQGWAIDGDGVSKMTYAIDGGTEKTLSQTSRPDVAAAFSGYPTGNEGFAQSIDMSSLNNGSHSITFKAYLGDGSVETIGTRNVNVNIDRTVYVEGISLNKTTMALDEGQTGQLKAAVTPANATNSKVTYKSSNTDVAAVDGTGLVTAVSGGSATITATTADGGKTAACSVTVKDVVEAQSIAVTKLPVKTTYLEADTLDVTGGVLTVTYDDGTTEDVPLNKAEVSADLSEAGTKTVSVAYNGLKTSFDVEVQANVIQSISVNTGAMKTQYKVKKDTKLDLKDAKMTVLYKNGSTKEVDVTEDLINAEAVDFGTPGLYDVIVTYKEAGTTFKVTINDRELTNISMKTKPKNLSYVAGLTGQQLAVEEGVVTSVYDNGEMEETPLTLGMCSGYTFDTPGTQTVTVTISGKTTTFDITVTEAVVTKVEMGAKPVNTSYIEGAELETKGGTITVTYDNGNVKEVDITPDMCTVDMTKVGDDQKVDVSYGGLSTAFNIDIKAKTLKNVVLASEPKLKYLQGSRFDVTGGMYLEIYNNGDTSEVPVKDVDIESFDGKTVGEQTITLRYNDSYSFDLTAQVVSSEGVDALIASVDAIDLNALKAEDADTLTKLMTTYSLLTDLEKEKVTEAQYSKLQEAIEKVKVLVSEGEKDDSGLTDGELTTDESEKAQEEAAKETSAARVESLKKAIDAIVLEKLAAADVTNINALMTSYNGMTEAEKKQISAEQVTKLKEAVAKVEALAKDTEQVTANAAVISKTETSVKTEGTSQAAQSKPSTSSNPATAFFSDYTPFWMLGGLGALALTAVAVTVRKRKA